MRLVIIRHGESEWNKKNLFTGWEDVGLSEQGLAEARQGGALLRGEEFDFDICHTSYLKRAIRTLNAVLEEMDREWLPVIKAWQLNERHYGALEGLNKAETAARYGEEQVREWRRSFAVPPPFLDPGDERNPRFRAAYRDVDKTLLPRGESLEMTVKRVIPHFEERIKPDMVSGKRVLIVAHGNSLRALAKHLERISGEAVVDYNIPTGVPLVYTLSDSFEVTGKRYIGNQAEIAAKTERVANQAKARRLAAQIMGAQ